jgi:hypothetical protein
MMITLYRREDDGNLSYYIIHDNQLTLVPEWSFTAAWTSSGARWSERQNRYGSAGEMDEGIRRLVKRRLKMGYQLLYAFSGRGRAELRGEGNGLAYAAELSRQVR